MNNNDRYFQNWDNDKNDLYYALELDEFISQLKEYLHGQILINERKLCTDQSRIKELDLLIDSEGRELDKFLIRGMAKYDLVNELKLSKINKDTLKDLQKLGLTFVTQDNKSIYINNIEKYIGTNTNIYIDISKLDVSGISDFQTIFYELRTFNQDISSWDVSKVTNMQEMFYGCDLFNQNINSWDVSNVTDMSWMFTYCRDFNQPLYKWNVTNVSNMEYMFSDTKSFNQEINNWNIKNVIQAENMLINMNFNKYLGDWENNFYLLDEIKINHMSLSRYNDGREFTKDRLMFYIDKYKTSFDNNSLDTEKDKYELIKYMKNFKEFDLDKFSSIMNELKTKSNYDKEFSYDIS
jgi:surface protein